MGNANNLPRKIKKCFHPRITARKQPIIDESYHSHIGQKMQQKRLGGEQSCRRLLSAER
jgi:hypothetical protein